MGTRRGDHIISDDQTECRIILNCVPLLCADHFELSLYSLYTRAIYMNKALKAHGNRSS